MNILKRIIVLLLIAFILLSIWNMFLLERLKSTIKIQKADIERCHSDAEEMENAIIKSQFASMQHLEKNLCWTSIKRIYPDEDSRCTIPINPKLVLIFSEFGCNVCQDNETRFAVDMSNEFGENFVLAVIHAGSKRYLQNYIRTNHVNFPVYYCEDETFLTENHVKNAPMVFIIDEEDRIIASHFPLPGQPKYSEPMHRFCRRYLEQYSVSIKKI